MPKAKPRTASGSWPPARSTFGWIMPAPRISSQPPPRQTPQPGAGAPPAAAPPRARARRARDVDLGARLGEGEEARPEAHTRLGPEEAAEEVDEHALQVGEGDALVHHE